MRNANSELQHQPEPHCLGVICVCNLHIVRHLGPAKPTRGGTLLIIDYCKLEQHNVMATSYLRAVVAAISQ
jgi:hypothetical protein